MIHLLLACSTDAPAPEPAPEPAAAAAPAVDAPDDACALVESSALAAIVGQPSLPSGTPSKNGERRSLCAWTWEGGRADLQVSRSPKPGATWASRMLAAKKGFVEEPGLGDQAVYGADTNQIFWRRGEDRLVHVSLGGDRPGWKAPHAQLRAFADLANAHL